MAPAYERTPAEREPEVRQSANGLAVMSAAWTRPPARRSHFAGGVAGRDCVAGSQLRRLPAPPAHAFSTLEVEPHDRGKTPSRKPRIARSHDAAADAAAKNSARARREAARWPRAKEASPRTPAPAECAAGAADDRQDPGAIATVATLPGAAGVGSTSGAARRDARQAAGCGARPSLGGDSRGAAQPEPEQFGAMSGARARRAPCRAGHIPARVAQRARGGMTGAGAETAQRLRRSPRMRSSSPPRGDRPRCRRRG